MMTSTRLEYVKHVVMESRTMLEVTPGWSLDVRAGRIVFTSGCIWRMRIGSMQQDWPIRSGISCSNSSRTVWCWNWRISHFFQVH